MAVTFFYRWPATAGGIAPTDGQVADLMIVDVISDNDNDVAAQIPHLMRAIPLEVKLTPLLSVALIARPGWTVGVVDAVNVNLVKLNTIGSGNAGAQLRVIIRRPHTLRG